MFGSEMTLLYAERKLTTGLSMMPLRKMRSRSLAVVELALSLSVSNTCGTAGGKRQRHLIMQLLMRYCALWLTHTVCFILISSHMDDIRSFFKSTAVLYMKYEFCSIFESGFCQTFATVFPEHYIFCKGSMISWTMPLTIEIWLGVYMIWCRGFKLQDWPFRLDHSSLIYEFHQNHTLCISRHYRTRKCQVELQGMISLKLGIPVSVPAICGTSVSLFISAVPGKSSLQMIKLPSMTFIYNSSIMICTVLA